MFRLTMATAKLSNLNTRTEKHGDDLVPAADLHFRMDTPNKVLDAISPGLRQLLFRAPSEPGDQPQLIASEENLTALRFPKLGEQKYDLAIVGCGLAIVYGTGTEIPLDDCTADGFAFAPKEGGTVELRFRVKSKPSGEQIAALYELQGHDVEITLEPPKPGLLPDDDDEKDDE